MIGQVEWGVVTGWRPIDEYREVACRRQNPDDGLRRFRSANYKLERKGSRMVVDTSGKWWIGDTPEDIAEFLHAYSSKGYKATEFRLAKCQCGSLEFRLDADDNEGVARRTCVVCAREHFICDSNEYWAFGLNSAKACNVS